MSFRGDSCSGPPSPASLTRPSPMAADAWHMVSQLAIYCRMFSWSPLSVFCSSSRLMGPHSCTTYFAGAVLASQNWRRPPMATWTATEHCTNQLALCSTCTCAKSNTLVVSRFSGGIHKTLSNQDCSAILRRDRTERFPLEINPLQDHL